MTSESTLEADPEALSADPTGLGWIGEDRNDPEVAALREHLLAANGIRGLEAVRPDEVDEAVRLFRRDGFVLVADVLDADQLAFLKAGSDREIRRILTRDRNRVGNRGSHRYSFGASSKTRHLLHLPEWAMLIDLPTITPIVTALFGDESYHVQGAGGDFCLPGAVAYQRLHADMGDRRTRRDPSGEMRTYGSFLDPTGRLSVPDLPVPRVTCNFLTVDFTPLNGPTRQIPGTQNSREPIPTLDEEPEWMRLSTVCPAPAGSALIRDVRAWHGGTPNLSDAVRAIPNVEYCAPWYRERPRPALPREVWEGLSSHGRHISRGVVALDGEVEYGYHDDLGRGYA
ncbi:MAG: phytanoyl-CoA dioxygenase family protein [Actinomycetota bacterium]